ncbi:MAG: hypothetical protein HRT69_12180 [Flavobacteriaceae bacterium]|nr:hypothetical protein [Flavobacteriaceae bacterium]
MNISVLVSTLFHEIYHSYQNNVIQSVLNGMSIADWVRENIGETAHDFHDGSRFMEMQAYYLNYLFETQTQEFWICITKKVLKT